MSESGTRDEDLIWAYWQRILELVAERQRIHPRWRYFRDEDIKDLLRALRAGELPEPLRRRLEARAAAEEKAKRSEAERDAHHDEIAPDRHFVKPSLYEGPEVAVIGWGLACFICPRSARSAAWLRAAFPEGYWRDGAMSIEYWDILDVVRRIDDAGFSLIARE